MFQLFSFLWCGFAAFKMRSNGSQASQVAQWLRICLPMQEMPEMWVQSLGREAPLEEEMAIHSSIRAWRIPWTKEPGELQSTRSQRVRYDIWKSPNKFLFSLPPLRMDRSYLTLIWSCSECMTKSASLLKQTAYVPKSAFGSGIKFAPCPLLKIPGWLVWCWKIFMKTFIIPCLQILSKGTEEGKMEKLLIILHSISFIKGC